METSKFKPSIDLVAMVYLSQLKVLQLVNSSIARKSPVSGIFCAIKAIAIREEGEEATIIFLSLCV